MGTKLRAGLLGIACKVRVDDIDSKRRTPRGLLKNFATVAKRLQERWLYVAAHKCRFSAEAVTCYGNPHSADRIRHLPERIKELTNIRRPETGEGGG